MIQRWKIHSSQVAVVPESVLEYVLYADHLAVVEEKDREIMRLQTKLDDISICLPIDLYEHFFADEIEACRKEDGDGGR